MSSFAVVGIPPGGFGVLEQLVEDGHSFVFFTPDLNGLLRYQSFSQTPLGKAKDIVVLAPYSYRALRESFAKYHAMQPFAGVICTWNTWVPEVARLSEDFGFPHLNFATASLLQNKHSARIKLALRKIAQPRFALARDKSEITKAANEIGFPVVIKPVDGIASIGVHFAHTPAELQAAIDVIPDRLEFIYGETSSGAFLAEELLAGPLVSCEVLTSKSKHTVLGITDRTDPLVETPVEIGGCFPASLDAAEEITNYVVEILNALNFDHGPSHVELIMTQQGPRLVEVNPRLIGGPLPKMLSLALGRPVYRDLIRLASIATHNEIEQREETDVVGCIQWLLADKVGVLDGIEPAPRKVDDGVQIFEVTCRLGTVVRPPRTDRDRLGYVITTGFSSEDALRKAQAFLNRTAVAIS